jgi:hypothetical protein
MMDSVAPAFETFQAQKFSRSFDGSKQQVGRPPGQKITENSFLAWEFF